MFKFHMESTSSVTPKNDKKCQQNEKDSTATNWCIHGTAKNSHELGKLLKINCLVKSHRQEEQHDTTTTHYECRKSANYGCKFEGKFLLETRTFYIKNEHNHPIAFQKTPKGHDDYVDRNAQHWRFLALTKKKEDLMALLKENWLIKGTSSSKNGFYSCRRHILSKCGFKAILLTANKGLYTVGEHNHPLREGETPKNKDDYFDILGTNWPFLAHIKDKSHLYKIAEQNCLKIVHQNKTTLKATCRYKVDFMRQQKQHHDCPVRATFLKSNSTLYMRGKHNHEPIIPKRRRKGVQQQQERKHNEKGSLEEKEENEPDEDEFSSNSAKEEEDFEQEEDFVEFEEQRNSSDSEMDEGNREEKHFEEKNGIEEENEMLNENAQKAAQETPENEEQNGENPEANVPPPPELEVQIVDEINRQEKKMLPPMKRECDAANLGPKQWPTVTIESEVAGWQWQQTRSQKEALLRPVKKEEPIEAVEEQHEAVPEPVAPTKMYLRHREKRINYSESGRRRQNK